MMFMDSPPPPPPCKSTGRPGSATPRLTICDNNILCRADLIFLTHRGEAVQKTIFPGRTSEDGKQQKPTCFIRGTTAWKGYSKQFHLPEVYNITSAMEGMDHQNYISVKVKLQEAINIFSKFVSSFFHDSNWCLYTLFLLHFCFFHLPFVILWQ